MESGNLQIRLWIMQIGFTDVIKEINYINAKVIINMLIPVHIIDINSDHVYQWKNTYHLKTSLHRKNRNINNS